MYKVILIRYGEIALKGQNRHVFINKLIENIKESLKGVGEYKLKKTLGRIYVFPNDNINQFIEKLKMVPGIVSLSPTAVCPLDFDSLKETSVKVLKDAINDYPATFKVETRRANKQFPYKSPEVSREIGAHLLRSINTPDHNILTVDVHNPRYTLKIEIRKKNIYVFTRSISGPGGLPVGSSGKGLLLLSGGIDSPVAGWLAMKRGIELEALYFHSFPYTSDRAKEKVIDLTKVLSRYCKKIKLYVGYFTDIQRAIQENCPQKYYITIMRRMMYRMAERIARKNGDLVLITGESVGQVASQTLESMNVINEVTNMPVLRPLATMNKTEIMDLAREIGTYDISILPHEDCCTIFVPRHPVTRPRLDRTLKAEEKLKAEIDGLLEDAIEKTEILEIKHG
ncbi:tRNA uracil 4-sulfurtransferase ThiI [Halothermothrix orenii]|uniref:Probable tRNA sulfurtransferase n=1 Tax=Halothermothrix orenii (strain H 168 / OCM 544 / DSM 9562) TaxID=373903 RepID=THII_HALOH|nr:tRNA uracil 4-sulfurtransferase ThiI [Halothermothrix orenii]B8D0L5.1 RecName: Full=Probable tRNA sulfurtransferase; AltName: Full=Sulfur carrier protein ThiS sulfurtransferase; AltName: Full=Thiamine biosynthesis protein ThiI; AltName: Full=tRNA 4-thiouridine synthase [Halothermothrix orenii H 168]ACL70951.1 thiamine biosynthesis/tRNA modification protein ThiI [Halothermothrix orenii H 168]